MSVKSKDINNKYMFKTMMLVLSILFSVTCININSYAADTYNVTTSAGAVNKLNDNQYLIPLYITDNEGIMGFRLYFNYDSELLSIDSITNGLVTESGPFATDVGTGEETYYTSVLWNTTEDVKKDGSLLYMVVTVKDEQADLLSIGLGYSQEDTFNEQWKDVILNCYDIVLKLDVDSEDKIGDDNTDQISSELKTKVDELINIIYIIACVN